MVEIDRTLETEGCRTFSEAEIRAITSKQDPFFYVGSVVPGKQKNGRWAWFRPIGEGPGRTFQFVIKATEAEGRDLSDVSECVIFESVQDGHDVIYPSWKTKGK